MKRNYKLYGIWQAMRQRIYRKTHVLYERYGGRGISICDAWDEYDAFHNWAWSNGYAFGLSIDRIDNDGNYCPENCRWLTRAAHASKTHTIDHPCKGEDCNWAKFCDDDIREIRRLRAKGMPFGKIGKLYGVEASHINQIDKGKIWSHVQ